MTIFHAPSVQSPKAYDLVNLQGAALAARIGGAASATVRGNVRTALQDTGYRYQIHPVETSAGLVEANLTFGFDPLDARRYGYAADNNPATAAANVTALNRAILVATTTTNGATGATVWIPTGIGYINQLILMPNRVRLQGVNCSGALIKATAGFTTPTPAWSAITAYTVGNLTLSGGNTYSCIQPNTNQIPPNATYWALWPQVMFWCMNGVTAMFDSILQDLFIDCSNVGGLGGILTDAWQENCGMRGVGVLNFTTFGLKFRNVNAGGQSTCEIQQCQFFPANVVGVAAGIQVDQISSVGAFLLHVRDSVIAGSAGNPAQQGINVANDSLLIDNVHFEGCVDAIKMNGPGSLTAINCSGLAGMTNLVHIVSSFTGRISLIGMQRNGATNFLTNDLTGEVFTSPDLPQYTWPDVLCQNSAKAWCVFDGTTVGTNAPIKGYNVTSVTRNGTGDYTINYSRPLTSAFACVQGNSVLSGTNPGIVTVVSTSLSNARINLERAGALVDTVQIMVVVFGV